MSLPTYNNIILHIYVLNLKVKHAILKMYKIILSFILFVLLL